MRFIWIEKNCKGCVLNLKTKREEELVFNLMLEENLFNVKGWHSLMKITECLGKHSVQKIIGKYLWFEKVIIVY